MRQRTRSTGPSTSASEKVTLTCLMLDPLTRRDWLKTVGAAGASALVSPFPLAPFPLSPTILPLTSSSDVFVPPRGRAFQKFSFDFPEPSVEFNGLRFGF